MGVYGEAANFIPEGGVAQLFYLILVQNRQTPFKIQNSTSKLPESNPLYVSIKELDAIIDNIVFANLD